MWILREKKEEKRLFPLQSFVISWRVFFPFFFRWNFSFFSSTCRTFCSFYLTWLSRCRERKPEKRQANGTHKKLKVLFGCWHIRCFFLLNALCCLHEYFIKLLICNMYSDNSRKYMHTERETDYSSSCEMLLCQIQMKWEFDKAHAIDSNKRYWNWNGKRANKWQSLYL